jgi:membrane protein implicated in regulation of membrane protease activity
MSEDPTEPITTWLVGGGIITMALFPLALPLIILTLVAALPLLILPLAAGLLALPVLLVRSLVRRVRRRPSRGPRSSGQLRSGDRRDRAHSSGSPSHAASGA